MGFSITIYNNCMVFRATTVGLLGQDMVSKVLQCATEESTNHDLRDRGPGYRVAPNHPKVGYFRSETM